MNGATLPWRDQPTMLASLQIQTSNSLIETIIRHICYHIPIHLQMPNHTHILTLCVVHIQREVLHS